MGSGIIYPYCIKELVISGMGDRFVIGTWAKFTLWSWQAVDGYEGEQQVAVRRVCMSVEDALIMREQVIQTPAPVLSGVKTNLRRAPGESSH